MHCSTDTPLTHCGKFVVAVIIKVIAVVTAVVAIVIAKAVRIVAVEASELVIVLELVEY